MKFVNNTSWTDEEALEHLRKFKENHRKLLASPRPMTLRRRLYRARIWIFVFFMDPLAHVEFDDADCCNVTRTYWR